MIALNKHMDFCNRRLVEVMAYQKSSSATPQQVPVHARLHQVRNFDPSLSREAIVQLIMGTKLPISFDENFFFQQFMQTFIPNYQTVSMVMIRSDILKLFKQKKLELQDEFKRGTFSVASISDGAVRRNKIMLVQQLITQTEIGTSKIV